MCQEESLVNNLPLFFLQFIKLSVKFQQKAQTFCKNTINYNSLNGVLSLHNGIPHSAIFTASLRKATPGSSVCLVCCGQTHIAINTVQMKKAWYYSVLIKSPLKIYVQPQKTGCLPKPLGCCQKWWLVGLSNANTRPRQILFHPQSFRGQILPFCCQVRQAARLQLAYQRQIREKVHYL